MLDSLIPKEDLALALTAKKTSPGLFAQSFKTAFKPLFEIQEPLSRLSGRKLAQHYSGALMTVAKQCNVELSRAMGEDWTDAAVTVMYQSIQLLSKIESHITEDSLELLKLSTSLLARCTEKKLLESRSETDKEFLFLKANLLITRANGFLQMSTKTQETMEEVYALLAVKGEEVIMWLSKQPLNSFDHAAIAKIYVNIFRLLFHSGKCLDSIASGDLEIHREALATRHRALFFFSKTRPNLQDYFAFAYASVQGTYRIAVSHQALKLFATLAKAISDTFELVSSENYAYPLDKNCCSLVEIEVFSLQKLQKFEEGRKALERVIFREETRSKAVSMQNAKFWLDSGKLKQMMGGKPVEELEEANRWMERGREGESQEQDEKCIKYLSVELENWLKTMFNLLNASTLDTGDLLDPSLLCAFLSLLYNYHLLKLVQDFSLFHYVKTALELVLFLVTREAKYHSAALESLKRMFSEQCGRFLSSVYNLTLVLIHKGEKAVAFDFIQDTVKYLENTTERCSSVHLCILDLWSRNLVQSLSSLRLSQSLLIRYLRNQLVLASIHEIPSESWERLIAINHRINRTLIESLEADTDSEQYLLFYQLHSDLHCFEERVRLAEREMQNCKRSLVRCYNAKESGVRGYKRQIEAVVMYLERELRAGSRRQLARIILEYIEVVAACSNAFAEETVLRQLLKVSFNGNSIDALCQAIDQITVLDPIPDAYVWKSMLLLERIKSHESSSSSSAWLSAEAESKYVPAVICLQQALQGWADLFQCTLDFAPTTYTLLKKKHTPELTQPEIAETIRSALLCADICTLLELHKMAAISLEIVKKLIKLQPRGSDSDLRKAVVELRLSLSLYYQGFTSLASDVCKLASMFEAELPEVTEESNDYHCANLWVELLQAERMLLASDLLGCLKKCENVTRAGGAGNTKREQAIRAKCCWVKGNVFMLQGDFAQALKACTEGRRHLQEPSSLNMSMQNLSLLASIKDNCYLKIKDRESPLPAKTAVYSWSSWAHQHISVRTLALLAEVYLSQGLVTTTLGLYGVGVKIGRMIGSVSVVMEFAGKKVAMERQMMPDQRLDCSNIMQEKNGVPMIAKEFLTAVSRSLFGVFLLQAKTHLKSYILLASDLIHISDESLIVLSPSDIVSLGHFIPTFRLVQTLITVGDLTVTQEFSEMLEPLRLSDQNFYKIAKAALIPQLQGVFYQSLRSLLFKKQAAMMAKKKKQKECINLLTRSILELGCCENFMSALVNGKKCCASFELNPHLMDELASSAVIYSDLMLKQNFPDDGYSILQQISSVIGVRCLSAQRQIGYLLSKNPLSEGWTRAYFAMKSIGVTYSLQMKMKGCGKGLGSIDEFMDIWKRANKHWSVVGLSIGKGELSEGLVVTRLTPEHEPFTFTLSSKCRLCGRAAVLSDLLEEFAKIMRESAQTIVAKVGSANRWWQLREALDSRLDDCLNTLQSQLFGPLCCLLLGQIADEDICRLLDSECRELLTESRACRECDQVWPGVLIYHILSAVATNSLSNEDIKTLVEATGHNKSAVMKKVRNVRKEVGGRVLTRHPVILVIDGSLLYVPWESMPVMASQVTTRLPSYQFLGERLALPSWKAQSCFYVVNPSKDLENTQATFQPYLASKENWSGIVATAPSEQEMKTNLEGCDLVLYCGHSSGEQYIKGETVKDIRVKAVTLLIGCSSGMLRPIGQYEPQGVAVQYMIGGCPALVANLWDVTDKDIDRFAMELLRRLSDGEELASAVSQSRHVCKLKKLIGAAPVVYGVPMPQACMV